MPMWTASGKSKPIRVGFRTRTNRRLRMVEEDILFYGEENVLDIERNCFHKLCSIL
jgi:hypothetical protein